MNKLENYLLISMPNDEGIDGKKVLRAALIKTGDHNFNYTQTGESLTAMARNLQALPPESVMEIIDPLRELIRSAGVALSKVC